MQAYHLLIHPAFSIMALFFSSKVQNHHDFSPAERGGGGLTLNHKSWLPNIGHNWEGERYLVCLGGRVSFLPGDSFSEHMSIFPTALSFTSPLERPASFFLCACPLPCYSQDCGLWALTHPSTWLVHSSSPFPNVLNPLVHAPRGIRPLPTSYVLNVCVFPKLICWNLITNVMV